MAGQWQKLWQKRILGSQSRHPWSPGRGRVNWTAVCAHAGGCYSCTCTSKQHIATYVAASSRFTMRGGAEQRAEGGCVGRHVYDGGGHCRCGCGCGGGCGDRGGGVSSLLMVVAILPPSSAPTSSSSSPFDCLPVPNTLPPHPPPQPSACLLLSFPACLLVCFPACLPCAHGCQDMGWHGGQDMGWHGGAHDGLACLACTRSWLALFACMCPSPGRYGDVHMEALTWPGGARLSATCRSTGTSASGTGQVVRRLQV